MTKRKKRLEKGIVSLAKQINLHEDKKVVAIEQGKRDLADYFEREIEGLENRKKDREGKLKR